MSISKIGWCVGRNPPSVLCGIRLIGLPAPSGRDFIGVCLPFPLAGRPFHRFQTSRLNLTKCIIAISGWTFRFCSVAKPLSLYPSVLQFYMWAEFPQIPEGTRKPLTNSPAQQTKAVENPINLPRGFRVFIYNFSC